ncbi:hypothetical protein N7492_008768 [Penicillium capsulatum]|uniref:Acyl-CoA thioesterase n=1 Tax=Penicillium capsulatum TaxID=69766 RepID=A0A9W9LHL3_9EURO|nr:hypothetical protein N7492_008768 [Penicillium capsulatum]KAJ6106171.1 hypothetical protein N7512_009688 [Penicillium capsulatum]
MIIPQNDVSYIKAYWSVFSSNTEYFATLSVPSTMTSPEISMNRQVAVEVVGPGMYRSVLRPARIGTFSPRVFGGNVLAIAVNAASYTTSTSHHLHSISGHFIRPAMTDRHLLCRVENIRSSKALETRLLRVFQEADDGSHILCLIASADFHIEEPRSMVTYSTRPQTEGVPDREITMLSESSDKGSAISHGLYRGIDALTDVESFPTNADNIDHEQRQQQLKQERPAPAPRKVAAEKFRVRGPLETEAENVAALAFYMDKGIAYLPARHNGHDLFEAQACATLDFSLRFDLRQWHVMEQETIVAGNARAFGEGRVWDESGSLLASMTQQTLLRPKAGFCPRI